MSEDGAEPSWTPHSAHWGAFSVRWNGEKLAVSPYPGDPSPSPMLGNFSNALRHKARVTRPMVRKSWLDKAKPHDRTLDDPFVEMSWNETLDLLAARAVARPQGSRRERDLWRLYGWPAPGRFHHAQSQVHRFLNLAFRG